MQHILFLNHFSQGAEIIDNSKIDISLITRDRIIKSSFNKLYKRVIILGDQDSDEILIETIKMINEYDKIDLIVTFDDSKQILASEISKILGIRYTYNTKTLDIINDKFKMREFLKKVEFENIFFQKIKCISEISDLVCKDKREIIVKPKDGSGSKSVYKINEGNFNVVSKIMENDSATEWLAEEFLEGPEYSVESYSENGFHKIYGITEKIKNNNFIEMGHVVPAQISQSETVEIVSHVKKFLTLVNITDGPAHTEVIFTKDGLRIVETQARIGGDKIFELYNIASNQNILELILLGMLRKKTIEQFPEIRYPNSKYACTLFKVNVPGIISNIKVDDTFFTKNDRSYKLWCKNGMEITEAKSSLDRIAQVVVSDECYDNVIVHAREALEKICIEYKEFDDDK